ncbi:hypothetical protein [Nocardioides sp. T2.26MG-1]|uniref:hypothetical protein n=1 Tax=Nocardioides sp. T2.26MG-1 TaxID=3041166 RepID=UPI00247798CF|nr:hypothetical protein [Nocardioides sp. T2.26MG-1]CAI9403498.1 hypothetical protein HIDPHFAB_03993 [Nocardioides sp. T2.26MG-1]
MTERTPDAHSADEPQPVADLSRAPLPTARTLRRRRSLPAQLVRFVAFNLRIVRMIRH